jgi:type IV pilus assembly protein PilX
MIQYRGATLAVSLIILLIVTILGISAITATLFQEKMAANTQDNMLAFEAAETGLTEAQDWITQQTTPPTAEATCSTSPCVHPLDGSLAFELLPPSWWSSNATASNTSLPNVSTPPYFFIELLQFIPDSPVLNQSMTQNQGIYYYQITVRGTGSTSDSTSIIQSTIARRF